MLLNFLPDKAFVFWYLIQQLPQGIPAV